MLPPAHTTQLQLALQSGPLCLGGAAAWGGGRRHHHTEQQGEQGEGEYQYGYVECVGPPLLHAAHDDGDMLLQDDEVHVLQHDGDGGGGHAPHLLLTDAPDSPHPAQGLDLGADPFNSSPTCSQAQSPDCRAPQHVALHLGELHAVTQGLEPGWLAGRLDHAASAPSVLEGEYGEGVLQELAPGRGGRGRLDHAFSAPLDEGAHGGGVLQQPLAVGAESGGAPRPCCPPFGHLGRQESVQQLQRKMQEWEELHGAPLGQSAPLEQPGEQPCGM